MLLFPCLAHWGKPLAGDDKPAWVQPRIKSAPKIRQIFWCDFWRDAHMPEMWKTRPVIIISYKNRLHGPCLVVPTSTQPQDTDPWSHKLSVRIDGARDSWAICNQPSTVAPSRLSAFPVPIPVLPKADFNAILDLLLKWLPTRFDIEN
jgi:mRNA interferase MazF